MAKNTSMSSGFRKYTALWNKIKTERIASVRCARADTITVMNGVKKEKLHDKSKPSGMILECLPTEEGVMFKLVKDTSINNL